MRLVVVATSQAVADTVGRMAAKMAAEVAFRGLQTDVSIDVYNGPIDAFIRSHSPLVGASAVASPGNLLGLMNGGYDECLCGALGGGALPGLLHNHFLSIGGGYAPVGAARSAQLLQICSRFAFSEAYTRHNIDTLILATTMVVPEPIRDPNVVFDCVWSTLAEAGNRGVQNVVMPLFGTGYGGVVPETAARLTLGAALLFYMEVSPLVRASAVLQFLGKDAQLFEEEDLFGTLGKGSLMEWADVVQKISVTSNDR